MLLRRSGRLPENAHAALNGFVIHISLPGADPALRPCTSRSTAKLLFPIAMAVGHVRHRIRRVPGAGRALALPRETVGALILTGSLANTSFIGLPMIETYYGAQGLGLGHPDRSDGHLPGAVDPGAPVAALYGHGAGDQRAVGDPRRLLTFAPFLALVVAFAPDSGPHTRRGSTRCCDDWGRRSCRWRWCRSASRSSGAPFAASCASSAMGSGSARGSGRPSSRCSSPASLGARGETIQITIFEAAMAPQIGAAIVAVDHDLDPAARDADGGHRHPAVVSHAAPGGTLEAARAR